MALQQKIQSLENKILHLKVQQQNIETKMVQQLHQLLKSRHGFTIPFPTLLGGLIDVIEQAKVDPQRMEVWKVSGENFQRQRSTQKAKPVNPTNPTNPKLSKKMSASSTPSAEVEFPHD